MSDRAAVNRALVEVLSKMFAADGRARERGADEVTDIMGGFEPWEVELASRALVAVWQVETAEPAQEAQLHALHELSWQWGLPEPVRQRLAVVDPLSIPTAHGEYLDGILRAD